MSHCIISNRKASRSQDILRQTHEPKNLKYTLKTPLFIFL